MIRRSTAPIRLFECDTGALQNLRTRQYLPVFRITPKRHDVRVLDKEKAVDAAPRFLSSTNCC